jgi:hypothetical protein
METYLGVREPLIGLVSRNCKWASEQTWLLEACCQDATYRRVLGGCSRTFERKGLHRQRS